MDIKLKYYGDDGYVDRTLPLEAYVEEMMGPTNSYECAENTEKIDKLAAAFGELINFLAEKKMLDIDEIKEVVADYKHKLALL